MKRARLISITALTIIMFIGALSIGVKPAGYYATGWKLWRGIDDAKKNFVEKNEALPFVKILTGNFEGDDFDNESTRIIEEKTGVKLVVYTAPWGEAYRTKQNVMLASNDIPDIMVIENNSVEIKYAAAGALLPLNRYFKQYPNIEKSRDKDTWNFMTHEDGNIYALPSKCYYDNKQILSFRMLLYRQDWLKKFNQSVPETLEEYYMAANSVVNGDPDGNGKKDTYAISGNKDTVIRNTFDHIFGAYGILPNYWFLKKGRVVNGSIEPEAKEALKFLNRMYKEGMIDPEFITDDQERQRLKFLKGMYSGSIFFAHVLDKENIENYYNTFKENNPEGEFVSGKMLSTPGYEPIGFRTLSRRGWMRTAVMAQSKVVEAALRIIDFAASEEGSMLYNFGKEGLDYRIEGSSVLFTADKERQREAGINLYHIPIVRTELWPNTRTEYSKMLLHWTSNTINNIGDELLVPEVAEYENQLNSYVDDQFSKMIMGVVPIEGGFERFVEEWKARGGENALAALNNAYERRNNVKR
jgi:ABC-type glycerol-3-phosphate transport system substrate-binding protein